MPSVSASLQRRSASATCSDKPLPQPRSGPPCLHSQIPNIEGRRYPPELTGGRTSLLSFHKAVACCNDHASMPAGKRYPEGLPIWPEDELERVIEEQRVQRCLLSYSDLPHSRVMELAARCLAGTKRSAGGRPV